MIGIAYFALVFGRSFQRVGTSAGGRSRGRRGFRVQPWEFLAALALFVLVVLAWLIPHRRAALVFSEAEIAFLFPAPVQRRTLIHFKLVRSQVAVLFTVFFLTLISRWTGGIGGALLRAAGWWLLLSTINLHLLGSSFARTILLEHGVGHWRRRFAILAVVGAVGVGTYFWLRNELPPASEYGFRGFGDYIVYLDDAAKTRPAIYLLAPFRWVVRPFLASDNPARFLSVLGPAVAVLILHYLWVIRSDVAFEEASLEASRRHVARVTAVREGRGLNARPHKRRRAPFRLSPTGLPPWRSCGRTSSPPGSYSAPATPWSSWAGRRSWAFR